MNLLRKILSLFRSRRGVLLVFVATVLVLILILFIQKINQRPIRKELIFDKEIDFYYQIQKSGGTSGAMFSNQKDTENTEKVKGVSAVEGQVLQAASGPSYIQYLSLPGKANYSSDGFNGSATVGYPVKLPPGPGGYTPSVGINYSSNSVDEFLHGINTKMLQPFTRQSGSLGLGWSLGESAISIDTHSEMNPCFWTYKISFPGGSGELFKTDASGIKIAKCSQDANGNWQINQSWKDSKEWRTDPEMFLKIQLDYAGNVIPGDTDFGNNNDIWKITTSDNNVYAFASGGDIRDGTYAFFQNPWYQAGGTFGGCGITRTGWKLYKSINFFGQSIKYAYTPVMGNAPDSNCLASVMRSRISKITYGVNSVNFIYNQVRNDTKVTTEGWDQRVGADTYPYVYSGFYGSPDQISVDTASLSAIEVWRNSKIFRKYNLAYYDTWQATGTEWFNWSCNSWRLKYETSGQYVLNDNIPSYHLMLKSISEEVTPGNSPPSTTFTYQSLPFDVNLQCAGTTAMTNLKNSTYLKAVNNGFGGVTQYAFDPKRHSDVIYESTGASYTDNSDPAQDKMNKGLKRARLKKVTVYDGISVVNSGAGNFVEQVFDYGIAEPVTVLTADVLKRPTGLVFDDSFVGYPAVTVYSGKKNVSVNIADVTSWAAKAKSFFHQYLANFPTTCFKKDPRAGSAYSSQKFDQNGVFSETNNYIRFKNVADISNTFPLSDAESCTAIPDRPLALSLRSETMTAKEGVNVASLKNGCLSTPFASYCNNASFSQNTYDWNFASANNPENGKFAGLTKNDSFVFQLIIGALYPVKVSSSQTSYKSQGYGIASSATYFLNKPVETWVTNPDNSTEAIKYKWQKMYYDNQAFGNLSPSGKNLITKTESLLGSGAVVGRSEVTSYDAWGNVTQTKDGNGNPTSSSYDPVFHAYQTSTTNANGQTASTTFNDLGLPTVLTDINNKTTNSQYDSLGRLTAILKPGDTLPSLAFEYHFNENATYGVSLAVLTKTRTEQNTTDITKILQAFDLYNGLGGKIQSQSLINAKVITSWGDQTASAPIGGNAGVKNFSYETFVSPYSFGKLARDLVPGTKSSFSYVNLTGSYSSSMDINNNVSYTSTNPETLTTKVVSANGLYSFVTLYPVSRLKTTTTCKDLKVTNETTFINERFVYTCPGTSGSINSYTTSDFLGNVVNVKDTTQKILTTNVYDEQARLLSSDDVDQGKSFINSYDLNGNVRETKDATGTTFNTSYDALNRPLIKNVNNLPRLRLSYDVSVDGKDCGTTPKGKVCKKESWDNYNNLIKTYLRYDDYGRVTEERANFGGSLSNRFGTNDFVTTNTYDNMDRILSIGYPDFTGTGVPAEAVWYSYTGPYLTSVIGKSSGLPDKTYVVTSVFDTFGRVTSRVLGNNKTETYNYNDTDRRLGSINVSGNIVNLAYQYENSTSNITIISDISSFSPHTWGYLYDSLSRIKQANYCYKLGDFNLCTVYTSSFDDLNNLVARNDAGKQYSFTIDNSFPYHGVKKINNSSPVSFDARGRMTSYDVPGEYNVTVNEFDVNSGKPQKISYTKSGTSPLTEYYFYDGEGNRIMKTSTIPPNTVTEGVLYVNKYLEEDLSQRVIRKNYYSDGKLVAVRVFNLPVVPPSPTAIPTPVFTITDLKNLLSKYLTPLDTYNLDGKVNMFDAGYIMRFIP